MAGSLLWGSAVAQGEALRTTRVFPVLPTVAAGVPREARCDAVSRLVPDAGYRCEVNGQTYDPCLLAADAATWVCGADPHAGGGFAVHPLSLPAPAPAAQQRLSLEALRTARYRNEFGFGGYITLKGGRYSDRAANLDVRLLRVAYGDLNGDGLEDAAVVLGSAAGGSGVFLSLAAVLNEQGRAVNVASEFLGERAEVRGLYVDNGRVSLDLRWPAPAESQERGSMPVTLTYRLEGARLRAEVRPLMVELEGGERCVPQLEGPGGMEETLLYRCAGGGVLLGEPRPGSVWTARWAPAPGAASAQEVGLRAVWQPVAVLRRWHALGLEPGRVRLDAGLPGASVRPEFVPYRALDPAVRWAAAPDHLLLRLGGGAQLAIYPVSDLLAVYAPDPAATLQLRQLRDLLRGSAWPSTDLPSLQPPQLRVRTVPLTAAQARGLRFLAVEPMTSPGPLVYRFLGLSSDGRYLLHLRAPLRLAEGAGLPVELRRTLEAGEAGALRREHEAVRAALEAAPDTAFLPSLADLDALVRALRLR
ncbi:hypothetical protein HNR42_002309 [Deinobacterium chartae]|uniref:Uncharacterized protein n=1 Tax=Deinobacterium chartae TaxID=521158 RepID=A0A841I1L1_9DEIO|nr:hypothetical protein [Deinobacterium chartae]MBB6098874.1 hypothetical protein [Deinobacterium chartae]